MARINLLPWREEQRKQLTQQFVSRLFLCAILTAVVVFYGWYHMGTLIDYQNSRNRYLQSEIQTLQAQLQEIKELESTKSSLLARMDVIQRLQTRRPQVVHLFHELASTLPDGVFLSGIKQSKNAVTLEGLAESNARVSAYMRNLDASSWLRSPKLELIEASREEDRISNFKLHLQQTTPKEEEDLRRKKQEQQES
ncbi:MAG: PilN domain-containing protein [Gammaproteobacteria bacterium]|nr:PilN domain-containing protein [Gammaproteobacteria bacterium]